MNFYFIQQWAEWIFKGYNWRTFTFFEFSVEDDAALGSFELIFILMGLGFRFRWDHTETEFKKVLEKRAKEIMEKLNNEHTTD